MSPPAGPGNSGDRHSHRSYRYDSGGETVLELKVTVDRPTDPAGEPGDADSEEPGGAEILVAGELCYLSSHLLTEALEVLIGRGRLAVTVDLSAVELCTAAGVAALQSARSRLAAEAGSLRVRGATGIVAKVLDICGVDHDTPGGTPDRRVLADR